MHSGITNVSDCVYHNEFMGLLKSAVSTCSRIGRIGPGFALSPEPVEVPFPAMLAHRVSRCVELAAARIAALEPATSWWRCSYISSGDALLLGDEKL